MVPQLSSLDRSLTDQAGRPRNSSRERSDRREVSDLIVVPDLFPFQMIKLIALQVPNCQANGKASRLSDGCFSRGDLR